MSRWKMTRNTDRKQVPDFARRASGKVRDRATRADLDTATGPRAVPARSTWPARGDEENSRVFGRANRCGPGPAAVRRCSCQDAPGRTAAEHLACTSSPDISHTDQPRYERQLDWTR